MLVSLSFVKGERMLRAAEKAAGYSLNTFTLEGTVDTFTENGVTCVMGEAEQTVDDVSILYHFFTERYDPAGCRWEFDELSRRPIVRFASQAEANAWLDSVIGG